MRGRRVVVPKGAYPHEIEPMLEPGDYAHCGRLKLWCVRAPNGDGGTLDPKIHTIAEHGDGTITVSPSIQFKTGKRWHGFLERGVWRTA